MEIEMRKPETIAFWIGRLPHWEVEGGRYFITIHLAGAIPAAGRREIRAIAAELGGAAQRDSPKWLAVHRRIFAEMERWLDRSKVVDHLGREEVAKMVIEAVEYRHHRGDWNVFECVVMPTHLHLFCEFGRHGMKSTLEDFKRWTGHKAARLIGSDAARFWQREWFDHWSRSDEEDDRIVRYMRQNPEKACLVDRFADWPYRYPR